MALTPELKCDVVMKGGITSGVVYPDVVTKLAKKYQFSCIGGTSAGAIAAAFAAAGEYARFHGSNDGFDELGRLPDELAKSLVGLFQPVPVHKKLFLNVLKLMEQEKPSVIGFAIRNIFKIRKSLKCFGDTYYGLCDGMTVPGYATPGLTDWLNRKLETVAGRIQSNGALPATPLTFGDLKKADITLRTITTNLSRQCPVTLPVPDGSYMDKGDLERLLPENIVDYFMAKRPENTAGNQSGIPDNLVEIPHGDDMPVLLAVRLSLSFPILLCAFPVYQHDWTLRLCKEEQQTPRLCWFSDGGISSNFPVHLFDNLLPSHPTFGISLGTFDKCRQEEDVDNKPGSNRVHLPEKAGSGIVRPVLNIEGLGQFLGSILTAAQNWQDSVVSVLPGYRERIVNISLKSTEGGLNLNMPADLIKDLTGIGEIAGAKICDRFSFDEHRWRRTLSAYAALEEALEGLHQQFDPADPENIGKFLDDIRTGIQNHYEPVKSYKPSIAELDALIGRLNDLYSVADLWNQDQDGPISNLKTPKPSVSLRMFPRKYLN